MTSKEGSVSAQRPVGLDNGLTVGLGLFGTEEAPRVVELAVLADELGYANVWIGDSQNLWREAYVTLGAAAVKTRQVVLGTGVTNVSTRHISVLASAWLTLSELSGGRVAFGIGTGDSSIRTMGARRPGLATLARRVEELRALHLGDAVEHDDTGVSFRLQFAERARIPIYVGAMGPKTLESAGQIADGVTLCVGTDPRLIRAAVERVEAGARIAGRGLEDIDLVLWTAVSLDNDTAKARDIVRPWVASAVNHAPVAAPLESAQMDAIERIRARYEYTLHMESAADHQKLVPDALADAFVIAGTVEECRDRVLRIAETPVRQIAVIPFAAEGDDRARVIESFMRDVIEPPCANGRKEQRHGRVLSNVHPCHGKREAATEHFGSRRVCGVFGHGASFVPREVDEAATACAAKGLRRLRLTNWQGTKGDLNADRAAQSTRCVRLGNARQDVPGAKGRQPDLCKRAGCA